MSRKNKSFRTKLSLYFVLFTEVIFTALWVLQTVFLQSFYNAMLIKNTKSAAQQIIYSGEDTDTIDSLALNNSLVVYMTDTEGHIIYSTDEYKSTYNGNSYEHDKENPYRKNEEMNWQKSPYRNLPDGYDEFLSNLEKNGKSTEYRTDTLFVYGEYISENTVLYVGTTLDPVGAAANIIRIQLLWVTVISVIIALAFAFFIAGKFSKPVTEISKQAKKIGGTDFSVNFESDFCAEIDELSNTLVHTNAALNESRGFQRELLANVSHDLRTPLTMIKGYAESIRDFGDDDVQRTADSEIIMREADRLNELVNEVLEYSELQTNGYNTEFERIDLSKLVKSVIMQFEPLFQSQGGIIECSVSENIFVNGNYRQLERVVYNLLDNAIRHTGDSKKIIIKLQPENGHARLSVRDYGNGIPDEQLPHIWERYYTYRQRNKQGVSGLGLAIVKQIVSIHNGECGVTSENGLGSVFWVTLEMC